MELSIQHITKRFGTKPALNDINIRLPQERILGLLGPNGAGKTTLLRIITQIIAPDSGEILINGRPISFTDIYRIGYVPEERGLYKKMKVGEQLVYLAELKGLSSREAGKQLDCWLSKLEIMHWKNKKLEDLSKGMQQKVQFIAAVIHKPDLIIFDEPFSGFDPINKNLLKKEILELKEDGATIILSTHNMVSVEELCDEIALINDAELVLKGDLVSIREKYKSNVFRLKIKGTGTAIKETEKYKILSLSEKTERRELRILNVNNLSNNELLNLFTDCFEILSFEEEMLSMNDIFLQTVAK
ncbi:MAG: ATP-binding cassette domain-containing protein [Candidatus Azobacteroides sp.]|nr:ATP-binding cassette domain-containing protein [Candidatus Azobacteroides sp.]